jgi:hypothetical protein
VLALGMRRHENRWPTHQMNRAMNKLLVTSGIVLISFGLPWCLGR